MTAELFKPIPLKRDKVLELLENMYHVPLAVLAASVGYGKTTIVREFLDSQSNIFSCWYSLEADETDIVWIWRRIMEGLPKEDFPSLKSLTKLSFPNTKKERGHLIELLKQLIKKDTFIVLDDFHEWDNKDLDELIEGLVYAQIPYFHIIIIGREYPNFSYNELVLKQLCLLIEQPNLTLTKEEVEQFFKINDLPLSKPDSMTIYEYTDGWISAVSLMLLDYRQNKVVNNVRKIANLFKTTVFDHFSSEEQSLLMKMSPLDNFTLEQAVFITKIVDCELLLLKCIESTSFIRYVSKTKTYHMHNLLKTVAREELAKRGESETGIIECCAKWFESREKYTHAIRNYIHVRNKKEVFRILEERDCLRLYRIAPSMYMKFFEGLTLEEKLPFMKSYLSFLYYILFSYGSKNILPFLEELLHYYKKQREEERVDNAKRWLGELKILQSLSFLNDMKQMLFTIKEAERLLNGERSIVFDNNFMAIYSVPELYFLYYRKIGQLTETIQLMKEYSTIYLNLIGEWDAGWVWLMEGEYEYTTGNIEKAKELSDMAYQKATFRKNSSAILSSLFLKLKCYIYLGERTQFFNSLSILDSVNKEDLRTDIRINYDLIIGYLYSNLELVNKIADWIKEFDIPSYYTIFQNLQSGCIVYGRILLYEKRYIELEALAENMISAKKSTEHSSIIIYGNIYYIIALKYLYGEEQAKEELKKVLAMVELDHIIAPFMENAAELLGLFQTLSKKDSFTKQILSYLLNYIEGIRIIKENTMRQGVAASLSNREYEIIQLVVQGYKNSEISEQLHIAQVTVEKALSTIYKKLGVSKRAEAVQLLKDTM